MHRFTNTWCLCVAFTLLGSSLACAEMIDNPQYKQWAKFKPGAWVKHKSEMAMGDQKTSQEMTTKLVSVTPEKAVVETTMVMVMGDQKMEMPAQKMDVPAKVEKKPEATATEKPQTKEGDETIDVGGKKYKCHWTETTMKMDAGTTVSKVWMCEDIPGNLARMESKSQMGEMGASNTTLTVTEYSGG
jgi:hypothetical protein